MGLAWRVAWMAALLAGCSSAFFSRVSSRSQDAYSPAALERIEAMQAHGAVTKADVLATLGPPTHVIGQADGEIFVYRRVARDTYVLNLNPGVVPGLDVAPPIPLYLRSRTAGRDDTLMVFFDADGRVRGESVRREIGAGVGEAAE